MMSEDTCCDTSGCGGPPDMDDIARDIAEFGECVIAVFGDEPDAKGFLYTIGNTSHGLPELIFVCSTSAICAPDSLLHTASRVQRERGRAFDHGELVNIGGRLPVKVMEATSRASAEFTHMLSLCYPNSRERQERSIVMPPGIPAYPDYQVR